MIKVTDIYFIDRDNDLSYKVLYKHYSEKKQDYKYSIVGYCTSLEKSIELIMRQRQLKEVDHDMSLVEFLEKCKEINNEMKTILSQIGSFEKVAP